ncbi:MAG: hypothetical protein ACR2PZ_11315 [Pseudomonadales bacterium]
MIYLLAKYSLLFVGAVALGVLLGRWWIRRGFVDVTDNYHALADERSNNDGAWDRLWKRLDLLDGGIEPKLNDALAALPEQPTPNIDLGPIEQRLAGLEHSLKRNPSEASQPDLSRVFQRFEALEARINQGFAAAPQTQSIDLSGLEQRMGNLERLLLDSEPASVDLSPLAERLADLERYVRTLPRTDHQLDLSPIKYRLGAIEAILKRTDTPAPAAAAITGTSAQALDAAPATSKRTMTEGPPLFESEDANERDDLKQILGVGPKLEAVLNTNGVYYFWQIASWSATDIEFMDARLEMFKGRIARDDWVSQAQTLQSQAGAAKAPG